MKQTQNIWEKLILHGLVPPLMYTTMTSLVTLGFNGNWPILLFLDNIIITILKFHTDSSKSSRVAAPL